MISVVVPIYNVEKYLPRCLNSIIHQTYKNIEIILINDGSTDNSLSICEEYAKIDKRIKIITQKNGGLSSARNTGIEYSHGQYITFVDSDDEIETDMIEYLIDIIQNTDLAVCQRQYITEKGDKIKTNTKAKFRRIYGNKLCMKEFFLSKDIDTVAWGKLYKTNFFKSVRYPLGKYHEDIFTTYKIIAQCDSISIGDKKKYLYRQRNTSISKISFTAKHLDSIEGNLERSEYIRKYYPELLIYAQAGIIYAANICSWKMAKSGIIKTEIVTRLQKLYKTYEKQFLKGKSGFLPKVFSIFAWFDLKKVLVICSLFSEVKNVVDEKSAR